MIRVWCGGSSVRWALDAVLKLEDSGVSVCYAAVQTLGKLEPATFVTHTAAIVAKLEHSDEFVRHAAVLTLKKLAPTELAAHAAAIVAKLEGSEGDVRHVAVATLGKLDSARLLSLLHSEALKRSEG